MNNTTKGEWKVFENQIICDDGRDDLIVATVHSQATQEEANAHLIALAGNLAQKYDLSKLEAATEKLRNAWETKDDDMIAFAVEDFLRAITRQPAGETKTS